MIKKLLNYIIFLMFISFIVSCNNESKIQSLINSVSQINKSNILKYPYNYSIFPLDIISPTIRWKSQDSDELDWAIIVSIPSKNISFSYQTSEFEYKIPKKDWEILKNYPEIPIKIKLIGFKKNEQNKAIAYDERLIFISKDKVEAPIFYRTVTLPFGYAVEHLETISWRLGYVSDESKPATVLSNLPICGNCHTFSKDGKTLGMDVDYGNDKGSYTIASIAPTIHLSKDNIITWTDYKKEDGEQTFGLLSAISPDGRYAISTLKDRSVFVKIDNLEYSQLFFPIKGILVYYDKITKQFKALKGADDKSFVQSNPNWFPDGKSIIFAKTKYFKLPEIENSKKAIIPTELATDFVSRKKLYKYDLYTVPFNNGNGGIATPLGGASNNGKSNYFAKVSPDGKWIVFTQAESFMLLMPDSKLYIIPSQGGKARLMNCNLSNMNSWHSWSPNGKWLVFSSKENGPFTQLYLTHIDENGIDSPPVLLENFSFESRASNIPEFVNLKDLKTFKITDNFITTDYYGLQMGKNKIVQGDFRGAINDLTKTLLTRPNDYDCYNMRAIAYSELNKYDSAIYDFLKCTEIKPSSEAYYNLGAAYFIKNDFNNSLINLSKCISLNPKDIKALYKRALAYYNIRDYKKSLNDYNLLINLNNSNYDAFYERALVEIQLNMAEQAEKDLKFASDNGVKKATELLKKLSAK